MSAYMTLECRLADCLKRADVAAVSATNPPFQHIGSTNEMDHRGTDGFANNTASIFIQGIGL